MGLATVTAAIGTALRALGVAATVTPQSGPAIATRVAVGLNDAPEDLGGIVGQVSTPRVALLIPHADVPTRPVPGDTVTTDAATFRIVTIETGPLAVPTFWRCGAEEV